MQNSIKTEYLSKFGQIWRLFKFCAKNEDFSKFDQNFVKLMNFQTLAKLKKKCDFCKNWWFFKFLKNKTFLNLEDLIGDFQILAKTDDFSNFGKDRRFL